MCVSIIASNTDAIGCALRTAEGTSIARAVVQIQSLDALCAVPFTAAFAAAGSTKIACFLGSDVFASRTTQTDLRVCRIARLASVSALRALTASFSEDSAVSTLNAVAFCVVLHAVWNLRVDSS